MSSSTSSKRNNNNNPLLKIPFILRVLTFVHSSGRLSKVGKMIELTAVTGRFHDAIVSYQGAVPSWKHGRSERSAIHHERLFLIACKKAFLWIVDTLIRAGVRRESVVDTRRQPKEHEIGLHLACFNIPSSSYTLERQAVIETLVNEEIQPVLSKTQQRKLQAGHRSVKKYDPLYFIDHRNFFGVSPFDLVIANGWAESFEVMFKILIEKRYKPFHEGSLPKEILQSQNDEDRSPLEIKRELDRFYRFNFCNPLATAATFRTPGHHKILEIMLKEEKYFADLKLLHCGELQAHEMTALHHACRGWNAKGVRMILEHEKKLMAKQTPEQIAARRKKEAKQTIITNAVRPRKPAVVLYPRSEFPDDELYTQRDSLLFMQCGHNETTRFLPITVAVLGTSGYVFSPNGNDTQMIMSRIYGHYTPYIATPHIPRPEVRNNNNSDANKNNDNKTPPPTPQTIDDYMPLMETLRELFIAYKQNREEKFPDAQKRFMFPNRLPGITNVKTNVSILEYALRLAGNFSEMKTTADRKNHGFYKFLEFLFTEPQKYGFDKIDVNEYNDHGRNVFFSVLMTSSGNDNLLRSFFELGGNNVNPNILTTIDFATTSFFEAHCTRNVLVSNNNNNNTNYLSENSFDEKYYLPLFPVILTNPITPSGSSLRHDDQKKEHLGEVLILAASYACVDEIETLIRYGANVNGSALVTKERPIHNASGGYGHGLKDKFDVIAKHLEELAKKEKRPLKEYFDVRDNLGRTPLMVAAAAGEEETVAKLIRKYKVDANASDIVGRNALYFAVHTVLHTPRDLSTIIMMLVEAGCDPHKKTIKRPKNPIGYNAKHQFQPLKSPYELGMASSSSLLKAVMSEVTKHVSGSKKINFASVIPKELREI